MFYIQESVYFTNDYVKLCLIVSIDSDMELVVQNSVTYFYYLFSVQIKHDFIAHSKLQVERQLIEILISVQAGNVYKNSWFLANPYLCNFSVNYSYHVKIRWKIWLSKDKWVRMSFARNFVYLCKFCTNVDVFTVHLNERLVAQSAFTFFTVFIIYSHRFFYDLLQRIIINYH